MSQNIEKEFKNLLNKEEYEALIVAFDLDETEPTKQTNIYFDTPDFKLKGLNSGLRIRMYEDKGEITLKTPIQENEKLETNDDLTLDEAKTLVEAHLMKATGSVADKLKGLGIAPGDLVIIGQLSTIRYDFPGDKGTFFLDKSFYQDQMDYELEFESESLEEGALIFQNFLKLHDIKVRKAKQKIERMLAYPNSTTHH
ncbi:CYTH domain-containing protein [Trichococcus flocculiformis]|uniref:CYTH domain-containing protein n=1 Tax=Trichococcus flocculiformis TaxID=82803 RepID=UPI002AAB506F|nr:CYTH domain-containing protein [Trichococcus flocculiformis]